MPEERLKILVVDDEPEVLEITSRKLRESGYDVILAADGIEALSRVQTDDPDIILLDVNMPRRDGFAVLADLRKNPPHGKWRPVIIVSARTEMADFRQGMDLQADHYLAKPCTMADILKAVRTMATLIPHRAEH
jgi:CheY-like chemotaxis protein